MTHPKRPAFGAGTFSGLAGSKNLHGPPVHIGSNLTYGLGSAGAVSFCFAANEESPARWS
jgi:hypothetical protein